MAAAAHVVDMTSRTFALARVSTDRQALDRQLDALRLAGVNSEYIIIEHGVSGDSAQRDGLNDSPWVSFRHFHL